MEPLGIIPAERGDPGRPDPLDRALGVPLVLWAVNNLRRVLPVDRVIVLTSDGEIGGTARKAGAAVAAPGEEPGGAPLLVHDVWRPFCRASVVRRAIEEGVQELAAVRIGPLERLAVRTLEDLELMQATAAGLAPDHPCVVGVRRMRLPLSTEVRAIVCDVDGVLTSGRIAMHSDGASSRAFHVHDGMGTRLLIEAGVKVGWLSAGADDGTIRARAERLGVEHVDVGEGDKGARFESLCRAMGVGEAETLYIGDDVNDLPAMERAGLAACPSNARPEVCAAVDLVLEQAGGTGCVRETADLLLDDLRMRAQRRSDGGGA